MKRNYYLVYLTENSRRINHPIICECIGKTNTIEYGYSYIFKDIITNKIIRPYYDTIIDKIYNNTFGTLTYNNVDKDYHKISLKEVLKYLKSINSAYIEEHSKILTWIEERNIPTIQKLKI